MESFETAMNFTAAEWLIALWLLVVGGLIGSFLNVVVYRLPAGMSIVSPRSRCPACKHPIRWFDNVPVLSWLVLGGRCRDCRTAIAPRYPLVEAITAGLFLVLAVGEPLVQGDNLPAPALGAELSAGQLWGIYGYHLLLLCTLLAAALVQYDGHEPPARLFLPALVVGIAGPAFWPALHPVHAWHAAAGPLAGVIDALTGLAAGAVLGWWAGLRRGDLGFYFASACAGLFLGWQAACALVAAAAPVSWLLGALACGRPGARRLPPTAWLALGALGWILAWGMLVRCFEAACSRWGG
jgi:leader peptidase (prepilin peptidase)/N-methyltransferase